MDMDELENRKLKQKFIHIPTGETVVVCTGVILLDSQSFAHQAHRCSWKFLSPEDDIKKESRVVKEQTNEKSLSALKQIIEEAGYEVPDSYGLILNTDFTSITLKKHKIYVRVSSQDKALSFSFQYRPDNLTSYHNAVENALELRDYLVESRNERTKLLEREAEANKILKLINHHKSKAYS